MTRAVNVHNYRSSQELQQLIRGSLLIMMAMVMFTCMFFSPWLVMAVVASVVMVVVTVLAMRLSMDVLVVIYLRVINVTECY